MSSLLEVRLKAKNYKCFGENPQGFNALYPINLIIGKNNSGKSALIDLIKYAIDSGDLSRNGHQKRRPEVLLTAPLSEETIKASFSKSRTGGGVPGSSFFDYGKQWIGKELTIRLEPNERKSFFDLNPPMDLPKSAEEHARQFKEDLVRNLRNPFLGKVLAKIGAERDLMPETSHPDGLEIAHNGAGATNVIQNFINNHRRDRSLIDRDLLNALNQIFAPDAKFKAIVVRQQDDGTWEIYLEEEHKGYISLSDSGSGLKTVILVLANTILRPSYEGKTLDSYIFAFEELENNLHPSLQRKLLLYIRDIAVNSRARFILTTHSNIVIDLFGNDEQAQIVHVKNDGVEATARRAQTYLETAGILDDLDFRASDLLQSNGVIWVEGPSDRAYLKRWLEVFSEGELKEGVHYQCVFYGGKLLSHLSAENPAEVGDAISILRLNKHSIVLMDSDKDSADDDINDTKKRIIAEMRANGSVAWVTDGREVENYITQEAILVLYPQAQETLGKFQRIAEYLEKIEAGAGEKFKDNKVQFAQKVIPHLTRDDLSSHLDMATKMQELIRQIKLWNRLPEGT